MDTNKSNVVPFSVIGPVSGQDITDRIILKDIISEGTSVPYFRSNGNDTFEVVNAETTQTVTNTTFQFEVEENGINYELEAKTSMTINAVTGGTLKVKVVTPIFLGKLNDTVTFDYIPTWRGQPQGLADVSFIIGTNSSYFSKVSETLLPDGITHRVTCKVTYTGTINGLIGLRFERTLGNKSVAGDGYTTSYIDLIVYLQDALIVNQPYQPDNQYIGAIGDVLRIYFKVFYNGASIPLNDPLLGITKSNSSGNTGADVVNIVKTTADYVEISIVGPVSTTAKFFTWTFTYNGKTTIASGNVTVPSATTTTIPMAFQSTLKANKTQRVVFNATNPTLAWTGSLWNVEHAIFESGTGIFIDKRTGLQVGESYDLAGLTPDQINRFVESVTPSWMIQDFKITGILGVLRYPLGIFKESFIGRNPIPIIPTTLTVTAAPYTVDVRTSVIDKTLNAPTAVIAAVIQERDGVTTNVKGTLSDVAVTGAATYVSSSVSTDGSLIINVRGTSSAGEVSISGTVTENGVAYPFTFGLIAGTVGVTSTPSVINTKIWETGTTLPFIVMDGATDVTDQITDVELLPTSYIGIGPNGEGWEILNANSTATTVTAQYTFKYNNLTYSATGQFGLEAWDGKTITVSGFPSRLFATVGREESLVFTGTYKGKPHQGFTVTSLGNANTYIGSLNSTPVVDGPGVRFGYTGISQFTNVPLTYVIKLNGTAGDVENLNRITITGNYGLIYLAGLRLDSMSPGSLNAAYLNRVYPVTLNYYDGGRKIDNTDPDLKVSVIPGVHATANTTVVNEILYFDDTYFYFRIISQSQDKAEFYNRISTTYKGQTDLANWWTYYGPITVAKTMKLVWDNPAVAATSNDLTGKVLYNDDTVPVSPSLYGLVFAGTPSNGNALISVTEPIEIVDPAAGTFKVSMDVGHTGAGITVKGLGKGSGYLFLQGAVLPVPQSPLIPTVVDSSFNGATGVSTVIKFTLNQKRIDNESFQILAGTLSGGLTSSGNGTASGFKANVTDGNFEFTMTGVGVTDGVSTISFSLVVEGISYPITIALNAVELQDNAVMGLDPEAVVGLYNESFTSSVVMTKNAGGVVDLTGASVRVSPSGIITPVSIGEDGFTFTLVKNTTDTNIDKVTIVVTSADGDQATSTIDVTTLNNKLWATPEVTTTGNAGVKDLYFTLKNAKGDLATDVTLVSIAPSVTDFNSVYDFNTSSNFFKDETTPGRYYVRATINWKDAVLNVSSTVKQGTVNRVVEGLTWTIPLSPITVDVDPSTIIKDDPDYTTVTIKFLQDRWNGAVVNTLIQGTYTGANVTGNGTVENNSITGTDGIFTAKVKSDGEAGTISIMGVLRGTNPEYMMGVIPFDIYSVNNPLTLFVDPNHGEGFPGDVLSFDYILSNFGEEVDTTGSSMTLTPGSAFGSYTLDTVNKKAGFTIIKAAQPETEVIDTNLTLSKSGPLVKGPIKVTIYGYKVGLTTVSSKTLTPAATNTILFDLKDTAGNPAVDATFSAVTCNSADDSVTAPQPAEVVAVSGTPGRYSFNLRANNPEGYGEVSFIATYKGGTTLLVGSELTFINPGVVVPELTVQSPTTISGQSGKTVLMNVTVRDGGNVVATDNSANSFVSDNPEIAIIDGLTSSQLRLKLVYNPTADEESKEINFTLTNNGRVTKFKTTAFISKADVVPELNVEWLTTQDSIVGATTTRFNLKLTDENGEPVTTATRKSVDFDSVPKYVPEIFGNYSGSLINLGEGNYYVQGNTGNVEGDFVINLVLINNEIEFTIPTKTYHNPGTPLNVTYTPSALTTSSGTTEITVEVRQDVWGTPNKLMDGQITVLNLTGGGATNVLLPITITNGIGTFDITPTGTVEDIAISGTFTEPNTSVRPLPRTFQNTIPVTLGVTVGNGTELMTLDLWESQALSYDVMAGTNNVNNTVTDVVITNLADVQEWIELDKDSEDVYRLKAIKAEKDNDVQWYLDIVVKGTYLGKPYSVNFLTEVIISANTNNIPENRFNVEFL